MSLRRGLVLAAGAVAIVLLLAALAAAMLMQPQRLARLVLGSVGDGLRLEIDFEGEARYRLRGTPMLEVHDVVARRPGDDEPLLRAARVLVSLPWSTVRDRSAPLVLQHIELDSPALDLPRLQDWLASRPPGAGGLPTLSEGITVRDGRMLAEGWELRGLELRLPRFAADAPLAIAVAGTLAMAPPTLVHFDLHLAATRPANGAGIGARGQVRVEHEGWQLPAFVTASGPLHSGDGSWRIAPLRFGASAEYRGEGEPLPFTLGAHGPLRLRDGTWTLVPAIVALRGEGVVPALDAHGRAALGGALLLELAGAMPAWPDGWPALPMPLRASTSPVAIELAYAGARDLSDPVTLRMERDSARAEAQARIAELFDWVDAAATGTPLPPLRARASAPRVEIPGGVLEGVEIGIEPDGAP
ncbi:hypothetical protein [Luteimonas terricola]|uniref:AsmA family protein n=1 Tax=Luteimonas terricola TaxID=645597 RepID=A0ABQ2EE49_9GAMM|nr:hypothetical protein [Luteimonas terricola]GGK07699.1 hypothetical protein GCM10011394_16120 [Luteimonas terricola]